MRVKLSCGPGEMWLEFPGGAPVDVARVLHAMKNIRPDVYARWCDKEGKLRSSIGVFVNKENIRYRKGIETQLDDGDEVYVIPIVAGG